MTLGRTTGEGADRTVAEFYLKNKEGELIEEVAKAYHAVGKKVIVVLNICSSMETVSWINSVDAVLCAFQPGQEAGNSITDVLTGHINPSGKLPMTFQLKYGDALSDKNFPYDYEFVMPSFAMGTGMNFKSEKKEEKPKESIANVDYTDYKEGIYVGYRYFDTYQKPIAYPFGFGLSYTTFDYEIKQSEITNDTCKLAVKVNNTGKYAGKEAIQIYVKAPKGSIKKPSKELKAFGKTKLLQPGETQLLTLTWQVMDMASFNEKTSEWELAKGEYHWMVGTSSTDIKCSVLKKITKTQKEKVHNAMRLQVIWE